MNEMASSGTKRPTTEQSEETIAVCQSCNRLSYNLKTCDRCGSTLEANAADFYNSDPKRPRLDPSTNPSSSSLRSNGNASALNGEAAPVPQALFVNKKNVSSAQAPGEALRPQALYANQAALNRLQPKDKPLTANRAQAATNNSGYSASSVYTSSTLSNTGLPSLPSLGQQAQVMQGNPRISAPSGMVTVLTSQSLGSLSQAPPSYQQPSAAHPAHLSAPAQRSAASRATHPVVEPGCITFHAHQIRIGTRKFRAVSPITMKDEGILFTLKDYTYAPVLLNARAIIKCKLLFTWGDILCVPVIFLYLESSCMRQIRTIFSLDETEFSENSTANTKRCLTIFPIIPAGDRSLQQTLTIHCKKIFEAMVQRYERVGNILEEITPELAIDLLYGNQTPGTEAVRTTAQQSATSHRQPPAAHQHPQHAVNAADSQTLRQAVMHSSGNHRAQHPQPRQQGTMQAAVGNARSQAPLLTIPGDSGKWAQMQKDLVVGGVYHVEMNNGRKYCFWDGRELKPCVVQNKEVQLSCSSIRIGSMIGQPQGPVKVKMDTPAGISFSVRTPKSGVQEVVISTGDIIKCEVCFERVVALFIYPTWVAGQRVAQRLGLSKKNDPTYDPHSAEDRRKHLILFLKDVNSDQKEALLQMKVPSSNKPFIEEIDVLAGRSLLTKIKRNTLVQSKLDSYLAGADQTNTGQQSLESLAREVTSIGSDQSSKQSAPVEDDDDDDVIMTSEEVGVKCPYTQQVMKDPVKNKVCGHNYEKMAINEFIMRKKGVAKCPYAGCGNQVPLRMEDLISNLSLKKYILENYKG